MLIGHLAPALAMAAVVGRPRLGTLAAAALLPDIALWLLVLAGVERVGIDPAVSLMSPLDIWEARWSHSLIGTMGLAAGFVIAVKTLTRDPRAAWAAGAVVLSHWFLDLIVHTPDLTIVGESRRVGWGLWNHPYLAMPLELLIASLAGAFYLARTHARDWRGRWSPVVLGVVAVAMQVQQWLLPKPVETMLTVPASVPFTRLALYVILIVLAQWVGDSRIGRVRSLPLRAVH